MSTKLPQSVIDQITASTGRIVDVAARLSVSIHAISKYRPVRRKHLSDAEHDQIIAEWLARIPTKDTAERLGVTTKTIQKARRRAMAAIIGEMPNGSA